MDFAADCKPGVPLARHNYTAAALCLQGGEGIAAAGTRGARAECLLLAAAPQ